MSAQLSDNEPLPLNLFRDDDDEEDVFYKKKLEALANGSVTPAEAAADFDAWIIDETNTRLQEILKRRTSGENQEASENFVSPNASGYIQMVFPSIAKLCSAFPPYSAGQNRIIEFLEALRSMPEHQAANGIPSKDSSDNDHMITLWPFGENWMALAEVFRVVAYEEWSYPYSDVETPGSETRLRWRNFQSSIARITTLGFVDCGFLCALDFIVPSHRDYPDFAQRKIGGPNRVGGDVIAGAQWIIHPDEGRYVYEQCKKVEKVDGPREMWSMERWKIWKEQFALVAGDERFGPEAQSLAKLAGQRMLALEEENGKGNEA